MLASSAKMPRTNTSCGNSLPIPEAGRKRQRTNSSMLIPSQYELELVERTCRRPGRHQPASQSPPPRSSVYSLAQDAPLFLEPQLGQRQLPGLVELGFSTHDNISTAPSVYYEDQGENEDEKGKEARRAVRSYSIEPDNALPVNAAFKELRLFPVRGVPIRYGVSEDWSWMPNNDWRQGCRVFDHHYVPDSAAPLPKLIPRKPVAGGVVRTVHLRQSVILPPKSGRITLVKAIVQRAARKWREKSARRRRKRLADAGGRSWD